MVHVVESYGGGVAAAVTDYARSAPDRDHALVYADRPEALIDSAPVFTWRRPLGAGHLRRMIHLIRLMRRSPASTLFHAHSSLAGLYLRLASRMVPGARTAYTPHCYAFERQDLSPLKLLPIRAVEKALTKLSPQTVIAACSPRELELAGELHADVPRVLVPNIAHVEAPVEQLRRPPARRPVLVGAGRLCAQKDPGYFLACREALSRAGVDVEARWLGGGEKELMDDLERQGVYVTGWLGREDFVHELSQSDVYLHSALWEGFPIAILEAVTVGVPVFVRAIPSMHGFDFVSELDQPHEVVGALSSLQHDDLTWQKMVDQHESLLDLCSPDRQAAALRELYG